MQVQLHIDIRLFKENPNIDADSAKVYRERAELIYEFEVTHLKRVGFNTIDSKQSTQQIWTNCYN